jgi:UDP-2,4-diacetamido-2,4,6-trideoxy-beta-L-altropyranose hydrolase
MGHLIRCTALAEMLKEKFKVSFILNDTPDEVSKKFIPEHFQVISMRQDDVVFYKSTLSEKDILVIDGYQYDTRYQKSLYENKIRFVYIDDLRSFEYYANIIINQADNINEKEYITKAPARFCLGPDYVLLRPPFLKAAQQARTGLKKISSVFISFGGADSFNVTEKALRVLSGFDQLEHIHVLSGPVNTNIENWKKQFLNSERIRFHNNLNSEQVCELMKRCQLALTPASSLSLEVCAVGMVLIVGLTAENQVGFYNSMTGKSVALGMGDWQSIGEAELTEKLNGVMIYDEKDINWFIKNQRAYIDGKSGERLQKVFLDLAA